jgi:hypothetical protein
MMKASRFRAALVLLLAGATHALAGEPPAPGPELSPRQVVEIQLTALQHNDEPGPNAGIARVWQFAHPDNKETTGPLSRFSAMIQSPPYRLLIDHRAHAVEVMRVDERTAAFEVTVTANSGKVVAYLWRLEKLVDGPLAGTWLTTSVSPPVTRGDSI